MKKNAKKFDWNDWKAFKKETKDFTNVKKIEAKLPELKGKWRIHLWCQMNTGVAFIKKHFNEIDFDYYFYNNEHITTDIIDAFIDKWTRKQWNYIVRRFIKGRKDAEELCVKYAEKLDWFDVCEYVKLSEDFIRMNQDNVNWKAVSRYQHMTEDFINEFKDKLDWSELSINKKVKSEILRNNKDKTVFHKYYADKKKLNEDMLHDNAKDVNWYQVSNAKRKLSNEFIFAHADKLRLEDYIDGHMVDKEFVKWIADKPQYLAKVLVDWKFRPSNTEISSSAYKKSWKGSILRISKQADRFYTQLAKVNKNLGKLVKQIYNSDLVIIEHKVVKSNCKFINVGQERF